MSSSTTGFVLVTAATTNGALVAAGERTLYEITAFNPTATPAFLKLYNKATAPTVGTDIPLVTIPLPAGEFVAVDFGSQGKDFKLGIGRAVTGAAIATDTTATLVGIQISGTRS